MPDGSLAAPLAFPLGGALGIDDLTPAEADAFALILSLWPPGAWHELYDIDNPRSDVRRYFGALGQSIARYGTVPVGTLRTELMPSSAVAKLPDWETALGLPATRSPPTTTAGRQAAVISKLRESGASYSLADIRSVIGPLLGYADATTLQIIETNRAALTALHTYSNATGIHISGAGVQVVTQSVQVTDDGVVSVGGIRLTLTAYVISAAAQGHATLQLIGPDGTSRVFSGVNAFVTQDPLVIRAHDFDGKQVLGTWTLQAFTDTGTVDMTAWSLFVEGAQLDGAKLDGHGAEQFYFAAYKNSTLVPAGSTTDLDAARRALSRIQPAHTRSSVITTLLPRPGLGVAVAGLVPAEFLPHANP